MSNFSIQVEIKAPELAEAICTLASALAIGKNSRNPDLNKPVPSFVAPEQGPATPAPSAPPATAVPTTPQAASTATPQAAPTPPASAVPTVAQEYTLDQLAVAATQIVDAGRRADLVNLLTAFGVQALTALPKEQYGNFATKLREMGAKI